MQAQRHVVYCNMAASRRRTVFRIREKSCDDRAFLDCIIAARSAQCLAAGPAVRVPPFTSTRRLLSQKLKRPSSKRRGSAGCRIPSLLPCRPRQAPRMTSSLHPAMSLHRTRRGEARTVALQHLLLQSGVCSSRRRRSPFIASRRPWVSEKWTKL